MPYWASTAAEERSEAAPVPQWLSASVKRVAGARLTQIPKMHRSVLFAASPVYVFPRVGSLSWYVDPESVVSSGTVPL